MHNHNRGVLLSLSGILNDLIKMGPAFGAATSEITDVVTK